MRISTMKKLVVGLFLSLALAACGDDSNNGGITTAPATGQTTLQSSDTGATTGTTVVAAGGANFAVAQGTVLKDAAGKPVVGDVAVTATYATSATFLPTAAQVLPANTTLKAYVDLVMMTAGQVVKTVNPAIPVTMMVPAANGTVVDIYSRGTESGAVWVKEGTATVNNGVINFKVSHFSIWAAFEQKTTGLTGGTTGGTTTN